ncbi:MAG: putative glycolipid-binding domain-containing protein [Longimicrobiales bacterium]
MERKATWASVDGGTIEHVRVITNAAGFSAEGSIVRTAEPPSPSFRYRVAGDTSWRLQGAIVHDMENPDRRLELVTDGRGRWWSRSGASVPDLEGCLDLDIEGSPFTNTLAIRRLRLAPGESRKICAAFVGIPDLDASRFMQRYSRIPDRTRHELYRYESLESEFTVELPVDPDGLLLEYPGYFVRLPDR